MKAKKSEIFWTSILALALLILRYIVGLELFLILWIGLGSIISILAFGILNGMSHTNENSKIDLWLIVFPMTWLIFLLFNFFYAFDYFYKKVIKPFNDKLNGKYNKTTNK